jgi:GT2 family glycosyltransferase
MSLKVSIIIVHYKTLALTLRCLKSLDESSFESKEIIIVDNHSEDDAEKTILTAHPCIKWISSRTNEGFGRANNLGASIASGKHLLFLNSDMIVPIGTLAACVAELDANSSIGALGPKLINEDGSDQKSQYHYVGDHQESLKDNLFLDKIRSFKTPPLRALMGSYLMIPRKLFEISKGFDPDFFMYCEELDLCDRIEKLGKTIYYFDTVYAIHKHGGSSSDSGWSMRQTYLSRALLVYKKKGILGFILSRWIWNFNFVTNFFLMWLLDRDYRKGFWSVNKAYYSNWLISLSIPFSYSRKLGNGTKLLRRY